MELTPNEFEFLVLERIKKARVLNNREMEEEHKSLYEAFKHARDMGYIVKCYSDNNMLYFETYSKEEYRMLEKKYRESGIY